MHKAVIIDDEKDAIESINMILNEHFDTIEVVGKAQSVGSGLEILKEANPDIVFLDIEMPDGTGFDLLERVEKRNFHVIFVTAYNQYAIKAFKYSALDYILKPIDISELVNAVSKLGEGLEDKEEVDKQISNLLDNLSSERPEKIALSTSDGMEFVTISDIIQVQGEGSYSTIKLLDKSELVVSKNLGEIEQLLEGYNFYRPHQSHLINVKFVKKINRIGNEIIMDDGSVAFLSRRKKTQFMELMTASVKSKK